ncbi:restriction endonuclease [[Flexibacter] sp. ATCC 35208]|uniref:restriction endonuclease n=1 Tax=[Flexibacter] sp. ATCC 35208 TaxID=1936242 RepID=UPI0009CAFF27|nr:restriction endonuclease [[Flexibacter] sp. ATCC 35208]OMP75128.1 hypothetical protein BW716_31855 [[Flexibacter] sp. ATCC 35208]
MASKIIGGMTEQFYHTLPDPLDLITTSPTKEAISNFLTQITYKQFPEFILDILVKILNHRKVDITDGQGDEQQDILTMSPSGTRCLIQCKHTQQVNSHYNGTDLDNMVTVCLRKKCKTALFVTNGDLTPQGKKYVTDREYNRLTEDLFPESNVNLEIDYWNDLKIWDLIKDNADILHKWFSGMGQTSGLRRFKFNVFVQKLPYYGFENIELGSNRLIELITSTGKVKSIQDDNLNGKLPSGIEISIKKWFQHTSQIDIHYVLPEKNNDHPYRLFDALAIEVTVQENKYKPELVRDQVIDFLFNGALPSLKNDPGKWWHITASSCKSFIFLFDVGEPREIKLCSAKTYVTINCDQIYGEFEYCSLSKEHFKPTYPQSDEQAIWTHESGVHVYQMFDQKLHPVEVYQNQLRQLNNISSYEHFRFYGAFNVDNALSMRIRSILPNEWVAMLYNKDGIIWGIPSNFSGREIDAIHKKLSNIYINVLEVDDITKNNILKNVSHEMPPADFFYISDMNDLGFPVDLSERLICLISDILVEKMTIEIGIELLKYKYALEHQHGFTHLKEEGEIHSHTSEIPSLLADMLSLRGKVMLDIGVNSKPMKVHIRYRKSILLPSDLLVKQCIEDAMCIIEDLKLLADGKTINDTNYIV